MAKSHIQLLASSEQFDQVIEVIQSRQDIYSQRYIEHDGQILQHSDVSPVPFFQQELFTSNHRFPLADEVVLVGGVLNSTGGGCLNVAFDFLIRYYALIGHRSKVTVPIFATYSPSDVPTWDQDFPFWVHQAAKDLSWKLLSARIPFEVSIGDESLPMGSGDTPLITLEVDTAI